MRHQYVHAVDIVPTVYELLGIQPPEVLKGFPQNPIEGESFVAAIRDPNAPGKEARFYAMLGQRALYYQGWLANTLHPPMSGWGKYDHDIWELYNLQEDRTQMHNVADKNPALLEKLKGLWNYYAGIYHGLPLDDRSPLELIITPRPMPSKPRNRYIYYPGCADVPGMQAVNIRRRSYGIAAGVLIDKPEAEGVLFADGGTFGGHSFYIKDKKLHYVYNWLGEKIQKVTSNVEIPTGKHALTAEFTKTGDDKATMSAIGTLTLYIDMKPVGQATIMTQPGLFGVGDGLCVGRDSASPISPDYKSPFPFTGGTIERVVVDVSGDHFVDHEKEVRAWLMRD
jgi:arylsulfatase